MKIKEKLKKTQEENKEKINETRQEINEKINETQQEINEKINETQEEIKKIDSALCDVSDPVNPQDVATKEYTDKISSLLNANIAKLTQLYIVLSSTQDENKEEIKKTQEEIKKTRGEINEKISKNQEDFNTKYTDIVGLVNQGYGTRFAMLQASYKGVLKKDEYQFTYTNLVRLCTTNGWYSIPYSGKIVEVVLKTPHDYTNNSSRKWESDEYVNIIRLFYKLK